MFVGEKTQSLMHMTYVFASDCHARATHKFYRRPWCITFRHFAGVTHEVLWFEYKIPNRIQLEFCKLMNFVLYFDSLASVQRKIRIHFIYYFWAKASIFCIRSKSQHHTRHTNKSKKFVIEFHFTFVTPLTFLLYTLQLYFAKGSIDL